MAHELTMTNGRAEMAYTGRTPWHGLGQKLEPGAPIEEWLRSAGMEWEIRRAFVRFATERGQETNLNQMTDRVVLFRSDNKDALSVVSDGYKPVQPREVIEFFRDLVGTGGFTLSTAGTLFGGRRFWALAEIAENFTLPGGDTMRGNLLLATSCDGTMNTVAKVVATRVVCNNTLSVARGEQSKHVVKVRHVSQFNPDAVKQQLGIAADQFAKFRADAEKLVALKVAPAHARMFLADIFKTAQGENSTREITNTAPYQRACDLLDYGQGARMESARGTAWGVLNAVTEYVDHYARSKTPGHRLSSAWLGAGDDLKNAAADFLLARAA